MKIEVLSKNSNEMLLYRGEGSALMIDLRNSTKITKLVEDAMAINRHVNFMMNFNRAVLEFLHDHAYIDEFAYNDTGDGCLCVFWDQEHPLTCLKVALEIYQYLTENFKEHIKNLQNIINIDNNDFGMAIHTGPCAIGKINVYNNNKELILERKYIYGVLANTVARLESFSKNYIHDNFLMTGTFRELINRLTDPNDEARAQRWLKILADTECLGEVDLKDYKEDGHWVLSLTPDLSEELLVFFGIHRRIKKEHAA